MKLEVQYHPADSNQEDGTSGVSAGEEALSSLARDKLQGCDIDVKKTLPKKRAAIR